VWKCFGHGLEKKEASVTVMGGVTCRCEDILSQQIKQDFRSAIKTLLITRASRYEHAHPFLFYFFLKRLPGTV
jgi:hypothetical protein